MGHVRLGELRNTGQWRRVVKLLDDAASAEDIAVAVAIASEDDFTSAKDDPVYAEVVWQLTQLPIAARSERFASKLGALGFPAGSEQSILDIVSGFSDAVEKQVGRPNGRTDLGELARQAAAESLSKLVGDQIPGLFGSNPEDLRIELAKFATKDRFGRLARDFYHRLTYKTLDYYLSRVLTDHVGPDRAFKTLRDRSQFRSALELHCREASEIVEQFAGGWYAKANFQGTLNRDSTRRFSAYALQKMREELRVRRADDA